MPVSGAQKLQRQLRFLESQSPKTVFRALRGLSFDVKADLEEHVRDSLEFSGSSTERFLSKYRIRYSQQGSYFKATVGPFGRKSQELLARHVEPYRVTPADRADLLVDGRLAIPVSSEIKRSRTGKIAKRFLPAELLRRNARGQNRGFVANSSNVLMQRTKSGTKTKGERWGVKPAYVLKSATRNPDRLDIREEANRIIQRRLGKAISRAVRKAFTEARGGV